MSKSYVALTPINFADHDFFVRVGDVLIHDSSNNNRLTVYRNGEIVKTLSQTTLGVAAMVKNGFLQDTTGLKSPAAAPALKPKAKVEDKPKVEPKPEPKLENPKPEVKPEAPKEKAAAASEKTEEASK